MPSSTRSARDTQAARRLAAEHATARALLDAATFSEAAPKILEAIGRALGWEHAAVWKVDHEAGVRRCSEIWTARDLQFPEFHAASRGLTFARGIGLPGTVWATGEPVWIPDVVHHDNFPRAPVAA